MTAAGMTSIKLTQELHWSYKAIYRQSYAFVCITCLVNTDDAWDCLLTVDIVG